MSVVGSDGCGCPNSHPAPGRVVGNGSGCGDCPSQLAVPIAQTKSQSSLHPTVNSLHAGELVDVFHRYVQEPHGYFMVEHSSSAIMHPSVGVTDGWTDAIVLEDWNVQHFNPDDFRTWPVIQWTRSTWYNRRGFKVDALKLGHMTKRIPPTQLRRKGETSEALAKPCLTLVHVRWGGARPVQPVTEGVGGWGAIGSTPSDNYINAWEEHLFQTLGPTYEIISVFFAKSEELPHISPPLLRHLMKGRRVGALYFMWPIAFHDGHGVSAYVNKDKVLALMVQMEAVGIPTRFPHASHLYRLFASKEWTAQTCLYPHLHVPLTTMVSMQAVALDPARAAQDATLALARLAETRASWAVPMGQEELPAVPATGKDGAVACGVAKLGWSWEAMDVRAWRGAKELQGVLSELAGQPGSLVDQVFVQEWVDFDVEMRHFVVEPDLRNPASMKPQHIVYTVFKSQDRGRFSKFDRYDRWRCFQQCFRRDEPALADAERRAEELIVRWLRWLQAQSHELPVVARFDILAKRVGPGRAAVSTGELTELGGCFLGWPNGPSVVFGAMLRSCLGESTLSSRCPATA